MATPEAPNVNGSTKKAKKKLPRGPYIETLHVPSGRTARITGVVVVKDLLIDAGGKLVVEENSVLRLCRDYKNNGELKIRGYMDVGGDFPPDARKKKKRPA